MDNIEVYLKPMEMTIDSDAKNLHKDFFFKYIRLAKFNNDFCVKTECRAQMKRAVTYKVDIAIDEHGSIDNVNVNVRNCPLHLSSTFSFYTKIIVKFS
jgi:hypothetical protein